MDVRCERCRAQYAFEEDQITAAGVTVQCSACGHVFRVTRKELVVTQSIRPGQLADEPPPPSAVPAARHPRAEPSPAWTIRQADGQTLTFSELNTLQRWIVERRVGPDDEVTHGDGSWVRLGSLAELQSFFDVVASADRAEGRLSEGRITSRYPATPFPPAPAAPPPPPPPPSPSPAPAPAPAEPVQVELDEADLRAVGRSSRSPTALLVGLLLLVTAGAVAYIFMPALFGRAPPPKAEPAPPPPVAVRAPETPPPPPGVEPRPVAPEPPPEPPAAKAPEPTPEPKPRARPPAGARQLVAEARRLREANKPEPALELYGRALSADPENVDALAGRGLCYFDLEQYAPAEASLQEALRLSPTQADALLGLAETYRARGRKAEAITMFERYLAAHPGGDEAAVARNAINLLKEGP
jgi:predicted Zn finger-like uncharacterized protein